MSDFDEDQAAFSQSIIASIISEKDAEIERLKAELGEMKLVLESQDLRLKEWHAAIRAFQSAWLRLPMYQDDYEAALDALVKIARGGR